MNNLTHLYTRIIGAPLAIHPTKFDAIVGAIGDRLGLDATAEQLEAAAKPIKSKKTPYAVQDGVAVIPIVGGLMKKASGLNALSGTSSYEQIGAQYQDAMSNPDIKGVLLAIDSPGGETSGLFELAEQMSAPRTKPVYAISDDAAFSAAYALATCADKIFLTRTAGVGSIGVFCCHVDQSGADQQAGKKYTFIHAGDRKVDGNSHAPLSQSAKNDIQAEVDRQYGFFVSLVAKNRNVSADAVENTEAGTYFGEHAVPLLADAVGTFEDAFNALSTLINTSAQMTTTKPQTTTTPKKNLNNYTLDEIKGLYTLLGQHLAQTAEEEKMAKKELSIEDLIELEAKAKGGNDEECKAADKKPSEKDDDPEDDDDDDDDDEDEDDDNEDDKKDAKGKGKKALKSDAVQIAALCELQGVPHLTSKFLSAGYSLSDTTSALLKLRKAKTNPAKVASTNAASNDPASTLRAAWETIMLDEKPNKTQRYAKFVNMHKPVYDEYNKTRKAVRSNDVI